MTINLLAVFVAALVNMVVGVFWYSPGLYEERWLMLIGKTKDELLETKKGVIFIYIITFILSFIMAYVLALFLGYAGAADIWDAVKYAFLVWLGFVAASSAPDYLFEGRPISLFFLNNVYNLFSMIFMAIILVFWGIG